MKSVLSKISTKLKSLQAESVPIWEKFGLGSAQTLRNTIKANPFQALTDALVADLSAILHFYPKERRFTPAHTKLLGIDRLLIIIDDYEAMQEHIGEFLVESFLPRLRTANFETTVIILGRDQLKNTHPAWDQHLHNSIQKNITVKSFSRDEMNTMIDSIDFFSETEKERAWTDTAGYPFYVQLWTEEAESGGRSAAMLKRFYDRTTRWMTEYQKKWLQEIIFVDEITVSTLHRTFANLQQAEEIFDWFQNEASIRDTGSSTFRVREYVRSRLLDYLKICNPDRYAELRSNSVERGFFGSQ